MDNVPNPDLIYDLFGGIFKLQFIRAALLLDVLTLLTERPSTAEAAAKICHCNATSMRILLDYTNPAMYDSIIESIRSGLATRK